MTHTAIALLRRFELGPHVQHRGVFHVLLELPAEVKLCKASRCCTACVGGSVVDPTGSSFSVQAADSVAARPASIDASSLRFSLGSVLAHIATLVPAARGVFLGG